MLRAGLLSSHCQNDSKTAIGWSLPAIPSAAPVLAGERDGRAVDARDDARQENRGERVRHPSHRARDVKHGERQEPEEADRSEDDPGSEEEAAPRVAPHEREPGDRQSCVRERQPERHVAQREHGHGQREGEPKPRSGRHQPRGEGGEQERPAGGVEGKRGSRPARDESGQGGGCALRQHASRLDPDRRLRPLATRRPLPPRGTKLLGQGAPQSGLRAGSTASAWSTAATRRSGRSGRTSPIDGAPALITSPVSSGDARQNG